MPSRTQRPRDASSDPPPAPEREPNAPLSPDTDAAMVLGMAATAMPFAPSVDAEAERWLRILRLYGEAGAALQGLGVSEAPLEPIGGEAEDERPALTRLDGRGVVAAVTEHAILAAGRRGAGTIGTSDVFVAVVQVYGADFDRVLWAHGTDSDEVLERLGVRIPGSALDG
jgi:hypothetical protein